MSSKKTRQSPGTAVFLRSAVQKVLCNEMEPGKVPAPEKEIISVYAGRY